MESIRSARIIGSGIYIPPKKVTNQDLEKIMDTSDEWIKKRSGIEQRFFAEKDQSTSDLGTQAARKALLDAKVEPEAIDLIITATLSPDHHFPGIGVLIQNKLGLDTTPSMDIRNQCSGFLYSLATAKALIGSRQYNRILIVCSEVHSKLLNLSTEGRDVAVLFGDGAGAVVLEGTENPEQGILSTHLYSQGEFANKLWIERPGTTKQDFLNLGDLEAGKHFPKMDGRTVFKHATSRLTECLKEALKHNNLTTQDIDHFLFHQANIRINEHVAQQLGLNTHKVHNNIRNYGNCSAASLPILLHENLKNRKIRTGSLVALAAFGAGFTWGCGIIRW